MSDGIADFAVGCCEHDCGRPSWSKLALRLAVLYVVLASMCWVESRFRNQGVVVRGTADIVGGGPKNTRLVRYQFHDPQSGALRVNTVTVPECAAPKTAAVAIEYIPGEYPRSRLLTQARPEAIPIFFWVNIVFGIGALGLVGYLAWEANHTLPRESTRQRARMRARLKRQLQGRQS
jgi:hypothetical protein